MNISLTILALVLLGILFLYENEIEEPPSRNLRESEILLPSITPPVKSREYSLWRLANHFPVSVMEEEVIEVPVEGVKIPEPAEPQWTDALSFVSTVVRESTKRYYFKTESGEMVFFSSTVLESNQWFFKEEREEYFLFERDDNLWMIKK